MEMRTSGVLGLAAPLVPRRGLPAVPPDRTVEPRSTRDSSLMTAIGDLRRSREGSETPQGGARRMEKRYEFRLSTSQVTLHRGEMPRMYSTRISSSLGTE